MILEDKIKRLADTCVKCGLCLPHCPTYPLKKMENESPRGRIALMQALAEKSLTAEDVRPHLDSCLTCRRCERMCPSTVPYAELIDTTKALMNRSENLPLLLKIITQLPSRPRLTQVLLFMLRCYQKTGLQLLVRRSKLLKKLGFSKLERLESYLPTLRKAHHKKQQVAQKRTGPSIIIHPGCIASILDKEANDDLIAFLADVGYQPIIPKTLACCGALSRHQGAIDHATKCVEINTVTFSYPQIPVITLSSGCYQELQFHFKSCQEINTFLLELCTEKALRFKPLKETVVLHMPCSYSYVTPTPHLLKTLLCKIPSLDVVALENTSCCGAAGDYFIREPDTADELAHIKIKEIHMQKPTRIITANIGCALHLQKNLGDSSILIQHPVSILLEQLETSEKNRH